MLSRQQILSIKRGEVIAYQGDHGINLLLVDYVDLERGVVSGAITEAMGVNSLPIDYIIKNGIDTAKWRKNLRFEHTQGPINLGTLEIENPASQLEEKAQNPKTPLKPATELLQNYSITTGKVPPLAGSGMTVYFKSPGTLDVSEDVVKKCRTKSQNPPETPDTPGGRPGGAATLHFH